MTGEEQQLLRAIIAEPEADTPRQDYARWSREHGDAEQADFIAWQCAGDARAEALLPRVRERWTTALGPGVADLGFGRGFPEVATLHLDAVTTAGAGPADVLAVLDRAPLRALRLIPPNAGEETPATEARRVDLATTIGADPRARRLRQLDLSRGTWGARALAALFRGPTWLALRDLAVGDEDSNAETARTLTQSQLALEDLTFCGDYFGDLSEGACALAGAPWLTSLRHLRLFNVSLEAVGAQALAASRGLSNLESLDLGWGSYTLNRVGPEGAAALAGSASLGGSLRRLVLDHNDIGDAGLATLSRSRSLARLELLSVKANGIGADGLRALAAGEGLPSLTRLELSFNEAISAEGVAALAASPRFARLETLWLRRCPHIGAEGARGIAESPRASSLRDLNLLSCKIGRGGARAIAESPYLSGLRTLEVSYNRLDDASRARLRARFGDRVKAAE
jgi:uncharacterized protein (TIGR02996 family)